MITILPLLSLLSTPVLFVSLGIILILLIFVAIPLKKLKAYPQEGVTIYFSPVLGFFRYMQQNLTKKDDQLAGFKEASKTHSNPKFLATHISRRPFLVLQDPQYIKEFLQKQNNYIKTHISDVFKPLIGNGLVTAEGEIWKRHRKIVSASFNFEFLKTNMPVVKNTTQEFLNKLTEDDYKDYSVISRIQEITGEIVGRIFFGENLNNYTFEGKSLTLALADITGQLGMSAKEPLVVLFGAKVMKVPFLPRYRKLMQRINDFRKVCFKIINDRKSKPHTNSDDLLSSLLATQASPDVEKRFSDEDIVDEFITFFIAGMDTTGHLIGMTLYNLTQYPQYLSQLKAEREVTYNQESQITTDTLSKMELLHSVLKETLRFYTPAPLVFIRKAIVDHNLLDIKIRKGDLLSPAFLTPAFDEKYFENPEQFNPARWTNPESKLDPYAFVPFSAGPRNCIGQHLAIIEAKVIMSEFLNRFEFDLKEGYKLKMMMRFLYEPQDELLLNLRLKAQA